MELIFLFCLYYLSQHPDFSESMKPLLSSLKDSEQMLKFMNDLSHFSELFSVFSPKQPQTDCAKPSEENGQPRTEKPCPNAEKEKDEKNPQSPTQGIADEFIERCLSNYFKNR